MNSQLFPRTGSSTKYKTKPLYLYQHRKVKLVNCSSSSPLWNTLLTKVTYHFHEEKAKLHHGRDKVNHKIIHLQGLLMDRICASILHHKIGRSGFLTVKNVTALLSSWNIYKHWEVLLFKLSIFLENFNLTRKSPMKAFFFCLNFSHKHKTPWNLLFSFFKHLHFKLKAG